MHDRPKKPESNSPPPEGRYKQLSGFSMGISLAVEFAAAVALFWFLGLLLDGWLGTEPWGQVVLGVVGWVGGVIHIFVSGNRRT